MWPWTRPIIVAFISQNWQSDDIPGIVLKVNTLFTFGRNLVFSARHHLSPGPGLPFGSFLSLLSCLHPDLTRPAGAHAHNSTRAPWPQRAQNVHFKKITVNPIIVGIFAVICQYNTEMTCKRFDTIECLVSQPCQVGSGTNFTAFNVESNRW